MLAWDIELLINVHVSTNAKEAQLTKIDDNSYDARIDEIAVDGRANKRLLEILSKYFMVPKSRIIIVRGAKSRDKVIEVMSEKC